MLKELTLPSILGVMFDFIGCKVCALYLPYVVYSIQKQGLVKENTWNWR